MEKVMIMRDPTAREVVARWLWGQEYALSGKSAIDFYAGLTKSRKDLIEDFLVELGKAQVRDRKASRPRPFFGRPITRKRRKE